MAEQVRDNREPAVRESFGARLKRFFKVQLSKLSLIRRDSLDDGEVAFGRDRGKPLDKLEKHHMDFSLLVCVIILIAFGTVMIISAGESISIWDSGNVLLFANKQIRAIALGVAAGVGCYLFGYKRAYKYSTIIMIGALLLCFAVFIPGLGITRNGATRWINLRVVEVQPSEILKFAAILFVSANLHKDAEILCTRDKERRKERLYTLFFYLFLTLVLMGVLYPQPHTSAMIIIVICVLALLFAGGLSKRLIAAIGAVAVAFGTPIIILSEYRMKRVMALLNPGAMGESAHQSTQALYALGSGGLLGKGLGNSVQKFAYLPEPANDFILPIIGEELGFVGIMVVFILFGFLLVRGFTVSAYSHDAFSGYFAFGITLLIGVQFVANVCVVTSLFPNTGITLPFISYGGSSLAIMCGMIGFLLSISKDALYDKI